MKMQEIEWNRYSKNTECANARAFATLKIPEQSPDDHVQFAIEQLRNRNPGITPVGNGQLVYTQE